MRDLAIYHTADFFDFREWVQLDIESITWQGRYREDFEYFWSIFFVDGYSVKQVLGRFKYAKSRVTLGPLVAWFNWLRDKFICYTFIYKGGSIRELAIESGATPSKIGQILRDFFITKFPHFEDSFNQIFSIGNMASPNLNLQFTDLDKLLSLGSDFIGGYDDEIMPSVEVTLYDEWQKLIKKMEVELYGKGVWLSTINSWGGFINKFRFLIDLVVVILISMLAIWGVVEGNKYYKKKIKDKISVNEPQFQWLDHTLKFKDPKDSISQKLEIGSEDLLRMATVVKEKQKTKVIDEAKERYVTETEVFVPSIDSLGRGFESTGLELSAYEEEQKGGYRDSRYGRGKVFRVMMNAVDYRDAKVQLNSLLDRYEVTQVDNVKPGLFVPGGVYYNLYVPKKMLKKFLSRVSAIDETTIYQNKARGWIPAGKDKVFIWIKSV